MSVPNLDRMEPYDLYVFFEHHRNGYAWRELFPEGGKGTRAATADLANYALTRQAYLRASERQDRRAAEQYEQMSKHTLERIPAWAMWHEENET